MESIVFIVSSGSLTGNGPPSTHFRCSQAQIMDQLLMYYLLWLDGHTIVQTVYSCIYLQEPARLTSEPGLASFVDAFLIATQSRSCTAQSCTA